MIKALCVDDTKRPDEVSIEKWVTANKSYHITHVHKMVHQNGIFGVTLKEISLEDNSKYTCFRADRFGIAEKDIEAFWKLAIECGELNDIDILAAINKELELYPVEIET